MSPASKKPNSQSAKKWSPRQIWAHNALYGQAHMMISMTNSVVMSATATPESKEIALRIQSDAIKLRDSLKTRRDP